MREMASGRVRTRTSRCFRGLLVALLALGFGQAAQALGRPTITAPAAGSTVSPTPTLSWGVVAGATWYRVWLSGTGSNGPSLLPCAFNSGAVDPGGCWVEGSVSLAITSPLAEGEYTLWVMAWNPNEAIWSAAHVFTVADRFVDKGYTVLDRQTGLEWEKKTTDGSVNDKDKVYNWTVTGNAADGTAFTKHLVDLNGACVSQSADGDSASGAFDTCPGFGHRDWRLPTVSELKTILDCSQGAACIDPIFGPTSSGLYWSSSTSMVSAQGAWAVGFFSGGGPDDRSKADLLRVRAVRGGL